MKTAKVLVVDDIQSNIEFIVDVLEMEGFEVTSAMNGNDAISLSTQIVPDLVLLDISMPKMDGYQVCKVLKESSITKHIPIIFLTARVGKEDILKGFDYGAVDYIVKPFNFKELISRVKTQIDLKFKTEQLEDVNAELEKKVEERTVDLQEANRKLQNAMGELSKLDKAKNEFVLHINHELRTPLNGILGNLSMMEEEIVDGNLLNNLNTVKKLTQRLINVSELSLLFTELKMKGSNIELGKVDLNKAMAEVVETGILQEKNIILELINPFEVLYVKAESKLLYTCLNIVLDNAVKYSPENSRIIIEVKNTGSVIELVILDNGPGFSEKALEDVFVFMKADNLEYHTHGFGVGLATAKTILDLMNGGIEFSNRYPSGAEVKLSFVEYSE